MRVARTALCLALAGSLLGAGVAGAATRPKPKPKPVCNLVTDPAGDANGFFVTDTGLPVPPSDDYLDVLSADIASDAKKVTAVIRLKAVGTDNTAPTGGTVYFNFTIGDTPVFLDAVLDGKGGATYAAGDFTGTSGGRKTLAAGVGSIDVKAKAIHITAPANTWSIPIKAGVKLSALDVLGQRYFGAAGRGATPSADDAPSDRIYTAGQPSCVIPGK